VTTRAPSVLLALLAGFTSLTAQADRTLLTGEGLQVLVPDDGWCGDRAAVVVHASRAADFADEARLQKLLGGVRAVLSVECPAAQAILMRGTVGASPELVYRASARAADDWRLVTEIAPQAAQPTPAEPAAPPAQKTVQPAPQPLPKPQQKPPPKAKPRQPQPVNPTMPLPLPPPPPEEAGGIVGWVVALLVLGGGAAGFVFWRRQRSRLPLLRPPAPPPPLPRSQAPAAKSPRAQQPAGKPPPVATPTMPAGASAKERLFAEQRAKYEASIAAAMDQLTQTQMALQQHSGVPAALRKELRRLSPQLKKSIAAVIRARHAGTIQVMKGALLLKPYVRMFRRLPLGFKVLVVIGILWGLGQMLGMIAAGGLVPIIASYALVLVPIAFFIERRGRLMGPLAELEKGGLKHLILIYIYADQPGYLEKGELYYQAVKVASNDDQPIAGEVGVAASSFSKTAQPGTHFIGVAGALTWQIGGEGQATLVATTADNDFARNHAEVATAAVDQQRPELAALSARLREYGDLRWLERRQRADIPRLEQMLKNLQRLEGIWAEVATDDKVFEFLLRRIDLFNMRDKATPAGILLHGYPGTGKAHLARAIAESAFAEFVPVDASGLKEAKDVKALWGQYRGKGPVVLFVEYADQVFPKAGSEHAGGGTRETTLAWIEESSREEAARSGIWVVMTAQREDGVHPRILAQFGSSRIEVRAPNATGRALVLGKACRDNQMPDAVPGWVIDVTTGSSVDELLRIVAETRLHSYPNPPTDEKWQQAINSVRSVGDAIRDPKKTWDRLVLPEDVKGKLQRAAQILREGEKFRAKGVNVPNILLIGPPGTGKSDIARTFANVGGVKFLAPKTSELKAGYIGQSAGLVSDVFARARASAPCILFIDELDFVAARRGSPLADSFTQEIVGQMLQEMEGVAKSDQPIFVLAATNVPENVDKAILERFTNVIEIPLPDEAGRREILIRILNNLKEKTLEPGLNVEEVAALMAKRLPGRSGRALVKLVDRALDKAVAAFGSPETMRLTREILLAEASPQAKEVPPEELAKIWGRIVLKPEVKELILSKIRLFNKGDKKAPKGLLLYGPSGTGKTEIARRIADSAGCFFMSLKGSDIKGALGATGQNVKAIWERARERERSVIFVDECESVFARRGSLDSDKAGDESVQNFLAEWDGLGTEGQRIWVVGATNRRELLDEAIVQRFGASVEIGMPDAAGRVQIIKLELDKLEYPPDVPDFVGAETQGFSGRNLSDLAKDVGTLADERGTGITPEIWREVIARHAKMTSEKVDPTARWDSLVVAEDTLEKLQGVCASLRELELLAKQGQKPPGGTLLFGPPGTGKTQIARTIANESGLPFISAKTADLKMGYTGQSGQKVKEVFQRARDRAPCVLFIDELESAAPARGGPNSDQFTNEIVTQLLQETEGASLNDRHVFLLGATNLPEVVDPALLDRFDDRIEIPRPDADQRRRLFEVYLGRKKVDFDIPQMAADLAQRAGKLGGREIVKFIDRAGQRATRRARAAGSIANIVLSREDLLAEAAQAKAPT
jgi:SpoVK/Ycf46/Vps4 family AAA+-type ATPase